MSQALPVCHGSSQGAPFTRRVSSGRTSDLGVAEVRATRSRALTSHHSGPLGWGTVGPTGLPETWEAALGIQDRDSDVLVFAGAPIPAPVLCRVSGLRDTAYTHAHSRPLWRSPGLAVWGSGLGPPSLRAVTEPTGKPPCEPRGSCQDSGEKVPERMKRGAATTQGLCSDPPSVHPLSSPAGDTIPPY